jgi:hypothetical protein
MLWRYTIITKTISAGSRKIGLPQFRQNNIFIAHNLLMKKYFLLLHLSLLLVVISCTKDQDPEQPLKINAFFSLTKTCNALLLNDTIQYIDSAIQFVNHSDTGQTVTYKWDFGDDQFSNQENAFHSYSKPGVYTVTLYTFNALHPSDTFSRNVRIIIGQKEFKGVLPYNKGLDMAETADKGTLILMNEYNYSGASTYNIMSVDSLLRMKWKKSLTGSTIRLSSLKKINNNEYILSGNYQAGNTNQFALSKINANGDLVWEKYISNLAGQNTFTLPAADGTFVTVGNSASTTNPYTVIVKCDANGNELWRKLFDGIQSPLLVRFANNLIETPTGYAFASVAPGVSSSQIVLTKLDINGNIAGQVTTNAGNIGTIFEAGVAYAGNYYMVFATNTRYVFMFSAALVFLESKMAGESSVNHGIAAGNYFYIADGSFQYAYVKQLSSDGTEIWSAGVNNSIPLSCSSVLSGVTRYGKKVLYTSYNEVIALSDGQNDPNGFNGSSVYMARYLADGRIK